MKILAIGAHPDDIEIYMYGLLSSYTNNDEEVITVVATDGAAGTINPQKNLALKRSIETTKGLSKFGKPIFLNLPDGQLSFNTNYFENVYNLISKINADIIITHSPEDYHPDHRALSNYVVESVGFKAPVIFADTLMGVNFNPEFYVDITEHIEDKKKAIMCHESQHPKKFRDATLLLNRFRSAQCNIGEDNFAECYRSFKRFPFTDISSIIPNKINIKPYYMNNESSLL